MSLLRSAGLLCNRLCHCYAVQSCRGYAPQYTPSQQAFLRQVLFAARHILSDCFGPLEDSRTGEDLIPWLLQVLLLLAQCVVQTGNNLIP